MKTQTSRGMLLVALTALAGCGQVPSASYRGPSLATIQGRVTAAQGFSTSGPVRLAIVWIANLQPDKPDGVFGITTQDLDYRPQFPFDFSIDLYGPPPSQALLGDRVGERAAVGWLVAYQDLNGNGQLDLIPVGAHAIDRIIGVSMPYGSVFGSSFVLYLESARAYSSGFFSGAKQGYNIVESLPTLDFRVVTSVTIQASDSIWNNLLVCEDYYRSRNPAACLCTPPNPQLFLYGALESAGPSATGSFQIRDCDGHTVNATVALNGQFLPYDSGIEASVLNDMAGSIVRPGDNELRVSASTHPDLAITVPLEFVRIIAPTAGASVRAGRPINIDWTTRGSPASMYQILFSSRDNFFWSSVNTPNSPITVPGDRVAVGDYTLELEAIEPGVFTSTGSLIEIRTTDRIPLTVVP